MDEKISLKAVDQYASQYASQLADSFFSKKDKITGPEILALCEIRQVNLFVIYDLLNAWKQESEKLKSSYFDYEAKPVAEALAQFQNVLSNHILIRKTDFMPLLKKGISQTLYLILAPYDFYVETLDGKGTEFINTVELANKVKYLKINRAPLEKLVHHLTEKKLSLVSGKEAFALLDHILEEVSFTPEDVDTYLSQFSKLVPTGIDAFYNLKTRVTMPTAPVIKSQPQGKPVVVPQPAAVKSTLADNLAKKKVVRLKESLTINQKFMFTKILFHGDFEIFSEAIDKLDRFDTLAQAILFLEEAYPDWDRESEEYEEFFEIIQNRFN